MNYETKKRIAEILRALEKWDKSNEEDDPGLITFKMLMELCETLLEDEGE